MEKQGILYGINVLDISMQDEKKFDVESQKLQKVKKKSAIEVLKEKEDLFQTYICQQEGGSEDITVSTKKSSNMFDKLVIEKDSSWKNAFDMVMLFASCYNVFTQAYYSAFGLPEGMLANVLDYLIEVLFFLDFVFCFCQEYQDEETYTIESDIKKIAKHYMKGSAVFDLLANIPFELFFTLGKEQPKASDL